MPAPTLSDVSVAILLLASIVRAVAEFVVFGLAGLVFTFPLRGAGPYDGHQDLPDEPRTRPSPLVRSG